ncbi:hypothetical protein, partial [Micromonospora sp. URMC 107]|uniref:hypothetical protein n=1 Tax=Micromonospora sp. URMC 107 TaxID=3423418 RepID=UPI003F53915B
PAPPGRRAARPRGAAAVRSRVRHRIVGRAGPPAQPDCGGVGLNGSSAGVPRLDPGGRVGVTRRGAARAG